MHSMTGYGRGVAENNGTSVVVQITAVNSKKQAEIRCSIPRELGGLEPFLRKQLQQGVERGSLNVNVSYQLGSEWRGRSVSLDLDVARHVLSQLREFAEQEKLPGDIRLGDLVAVPGVVQHQDDIPDELLQNLALAALNDAVEGLRGMRATEGEALRADLQARCEALREAVAVISSRADLAQVQHRDRLLERIAKLGLELAGDDERLAREVAFHVDRSDITEEIVRLRSHLEQFTALLEEDGAVGRNLDFLAQEMNREISTLGAKTTDSEVSERVIECKVELGRIREQILNVE